MYLRLLMRRVGPVKAGPFALNGAGALLRNATKFGVGHEYAAADLERFDGPGVEQSGQVSGTDAKEFGSVTKGPRCPVRAGRGGNRSVDGLHGLCSTTGNPQSAVRIHVVADVPDRYVEQWRERLEMPSECRRC